jgi:hypothetical protein
VTALAAGIAILMAAFVAGDSLNMAALAGGWDVLQGASAASPRAPISRCTWSSSTPRQGRKAERALAGRERSLRSNRLRSLKPARPAAR